jgi:amidohydrolase
MDVLPMPETNGFAHRSVSAGVIHACGHDGHTAMLLGTAKYFASTRDLAGTINFIFQPAEEGLTGALAMVEDGLFSRFPCDAVYGVHNLPELPLGTVAIRAGTVLAAVDYFSVVLRGKSSHGAQPHRCPSRCVRRGGVTQTKQPPANPARFTARSRSRADQLA